MNGNGRWIWFSKDIIQNSYGDFLEIVEYTEGKIIIKIACDYQYNLYVNGELAGFGQYSDYPEHKFYDVIDITKFLRKGKNIIGITVWYLGVTSQRYKIGKPGLVYEISCDNKIIAASGKNTKSRQSLAYSHDFQLRITPQIGLSNFYDSTKEDDWKVTGDGTIFSDAVEFNDVIKNIYERPIKRLTLCDRVKSKIVQQGEFITVERDNLTAMYNQSFLSFNMLHDITNNFNIKNDFSNSIHLKSINGQSLYFTIDLMNTEAGFIDFDLEVMEECDIYITFGEHLEDGRVRASIGDLRNFIIKYKAKYGRQNYLNSMLRTGCRYLQFFISTKEVKVYYAGLRPTVYPVEILPYHTDNLLHQAIYDTAVRTLQICMHEHYEDTPWREQALYTMDSKMQMLYGYYAFNNHEFPKADLNFIQYGLNNNGLLDITFPTDIDLPIPMYSFIYPVQIYEYCIHSNDWDTARKLLKPVEFILKKAIARISKNGLIADYDAPCWNFYEWGLGKGNPGDINVILNSMLSYSLHYSSLLCEKTGENDLASYYRVVKDNLNKQIYANFFDADKKVFFDKANTQIKTYSELGNSLAVLCGAISPKDAESICIMLQDESSILTKTSLFTKYFKYEAVLFIDENNSKKYIIDDIDKTFLKMLQKNATTFWETEKGDRDFMYAGSLSHAWAAYPVYYYKKFGV